VKHAESIATCVVDFSPFRPCVGGGYHEGHPQTEGIQRSTEEERGRRTVPPICRNNQLLEDAGANAYHLPERCRRQGHNHRDPPQERGWPTLVARRVED